MMNIVSATLVRHRRALLFLASFAITALAFHDRGTTDFDEPLRWADESSRERQERIDRRKQDCVRIYAIEATKPVPADSFYYDAYDDVCRFFYAADSAPDQADCEQLRISSDDSSLSFDGRRYLARQWANCVGGRIEKEF